MLIRYRLILWFVVFATMVLLSFSLFIFFTYQQDRKSFFEQRLYRRVLGTQQLFDPAGNLKGSINTVLDEQSDMVFTGSDSLYYSKISVDDYHPSPAFLDSVRAVGKIFFSYTPPNYEAPKQGVAMAYRVSFQSDGEKPYVAIITAYDTEGYQRVEYLGDLLILSTLICIGLVGLFAHFFSQRALSPLNALIGQIQGRFNHTLSFRLKNLTPNDEIGSLTTSFNELLDQNERLVSNQRAFISQASHELRTPMATLKGVLETALYYDKDEQSLRESQQKAIQELDRLISLSNGLLQLASIENEEDYINTQHVDLMDILMDSIEQVQASWPEHKIKLLFSDGITHQDRSLLIQGEESLLKSAISNLIDNACKYSVNGEEVSVTLEMNTETRLRLKIKDHGIGIPPSELKNVFEPLQRGSNVAERPGFGIGLTLSQRIIRLHHGKMQISSDLGRGTEIVIDFPFPR